ncbi:MAG: ABC transporter ATP-binding protein [Acidobacteriota bacterium]
MSELVRIENLSFAYPGGRRALAEISLRLEEGEKVALLGANGAGKSTLLLHLNGLLRGEGQVAVAGVPVQANTLRRVRALVGLVFQDPDDQLFCSTVSEDVAFGPRYQGLPELEVQERVRRTLERVGISHLADRNPFEMSEGEKKLAALATVLSMDPVVLALDEPTAFLDGRSRRRLIDVLSRLPQTLLVATHDLDLARRLLPRSVVLREGRIVADGPTADVLADEDLLLDCGLL